MDKIRRVIFPLIAFLFIAAALAYRLSSCVSNAGGKAEPEASASDGPTAPSPPSPSPEPPASPAAAFSDDDIKELYKKAGFEVREIRDAGGAALVRYCPSGSDGVSERSFFAWFDRAAGTRYVVFDGLTADRYDVAEDRTLTVLTTGTDDDGGRQMFPEIWVSSYSDAPESVRYKNGVLPYYMPLDRSCAVGDDRPALIKSVSVDIDAVTVGFVPPPGQDGDLETAFRNIPKTGVVTSGGVCYITFYNTTPAADIRLPKAGSGDGLRSFAGLKSDGTNTVLTLKLSDTARRYNISEGFSPGDNMPYAVFRFRSEGDIDPPYPKGW